MSTLANTQSAVGAGLLPHASAGISRRRPAEQSRCGKLAVDTTAASVRGDQMKAFAPEPPD